MISDARRQRWGQVGGAWTWGFREKLRNEMALGGEGGQTVFPCTRHFLEAASLVGK